MRIDDFRQFEVAVALCLRFEYWQYSDYILCQLRTEYRCMLTYSGGLAGSMMTASFVLSSDKR